MPFHLMAFSESAARNGLDGITPAPPSNLEPYGSISGDNFTLNRATNIIGLGLYSEDQTNVVEWRIHRTDLVNWLHANCAVGGIAEPLVPLTGLNYPVPVNKVLQAQANNANNAQLDTLIVAFGRPGQLSPIPLPYSMIVEAVGGGTLTADNWTNAGTITWSETFEPGRRYQIVGMHYVGATGHCARLVLPGVVEKPGCFGSAVNPEDRVRPTWGDFGSFIGTTPPTIECLADAGDTAETVTLFLR